MANDGFIPDSQSSGSDGFVPDSSQTAQGGSTLDKIASTDQKYVLNPMAKAGGFLQKYGTPLGSQGSPQSMLQSAIPAASRLFSKGGQFATEQLTKQGADPYTSAGVGTLISMAPDVASLDLAPPAAEGASGSNFLQNMGARGINKSAGITPRTISELAGSGNPAEAGTQLGQTLSKEGAVGFTPGSTFQKVSQVHDQFGQAVGQAINNIKAAGVPTTIDANEALQPLVDKWTQYSNSALSGNKLMARPYEQIYGKLAGIASQNSGQLGIDELRSAMDEVGTALDGSGIGTPKEAAYSSLYGDLADIRDNIVNKVAQSANDPGLKNALLNANQGYSTFSRILRDVRMAAAREGAGTGSLLSGHPISSMMDVLRPILSRTALSLGNSLGTAGREVPPVSSILEDNAETPLPFFGSQQNQQMPQPLFRKPQPAVGSARG